jgi:hypothetical protein
MPAITVDLKDKPKILSKKVWKQAVKTGTRRAARFWHRRLLKKHFTTSGAQEYKMEKRKVSYMEAKEEYKHHQRPLEWSGETKRAALSIEDIRVTAKSATVVLRGLPWYIKQSKFMRNHPDMEAEIKEMSEKDITLLGNIIQREITRHANNVAQGGSGLSIR